MADRKSDSKKSFDRNAFTASAWEAEIAGPGVFFEIIEARYRRSKNPIWGWYAYRFARERAWPVPEWFLGYLDDIADRLLKMSNESYQHDRRYSADGPQSLQAAIAAALDLKTTGGETQFIRFAKDFRDLEIYLQVQDERQLMPDRSDTKIFKKIAKQFDGLDHDAIRKIVKAQSERLKIEK
jgi:hypothetical protein